MARRALLLVSLALLLLAWCAISTFAVLVLYHLFATLFSRSRTYSLSFQHENANSLFASTAIASYGLVSVTVHLTLPESDANLANSAAPVRICVGNECVRNTLALRFRSPAHRTARAVILAVPLLAGIVDEYQRVQIESTIDGTGVDNKLSVLIEAPLQISEAKAVIIPTQPPFSSYLSKRLLAVILAYWYAALACTLVTLRIYSRLQAHVLRRLWPSGMRPGTRERGSAAAEPCKSEPQLVGSTKKNKAGTSSSASRPPIFGKSAPRSSTSLRRRRMTVKGAPDTIAPACLLNGTYVK